MFFASLFSILLLTLSFPTVVGDFQFPDLGFLVWVGWLPFLVALRRRRGSTWGLSFSVTVGYYLLSMYWLFFAMRNYGGLSGIVSVLVLVLLCLILAPYAALAFGLAGFLERRARLPFILTLPVLWTLAEWARERFPLGGYPWSNPAYALGHSPYLMQVAEFVGVHGLVYAIMLVNVLLAEGVVRFMARQSWRAAAGPIGLAGVVFLSLYVLGYGRFRAVDDRLSAIRDAHAPVRVGLLQGNIPQSDKWNPSWANAIRRDYRLQSQVAFSKGAQVVIWPEAAYPYTISKEDTTLDWFQWLEPDTHLLMGGIMERELGSETKNYNSAMWLRTGGLLLDQVDKVHLVPFGEYVPYKQLFTFARALTQAVGDFYPGERAHLLKTPFGNWAVLICYEDLFPVLTQDLVQAGAQVLVNLTNDAWYERSGAAYQHLVYSQFRALEGRRYLLRATNTGVTGVINPLGQVEESLPWFERDVLVGSVWPIEQKELKSAYFTSYPVFIGAMFGFLVCFLIVCLIRSFGSKKM